MLQSGPRSLASDENSYWSTFQVICNSFPRYRVFNLNICAISVNYPMCLLVVIIIIFVERRHHCSSQPPWIIMKFECKIANVDKTLVTDHLNTTPPIRVLMLGTVNCIDSSCSTPPLCIHWRSSPIECNWRYPFMHECTQYGKGEHERMVNAI